MKNRKESNGEGLIKINRNRKKDRNNGIEKKSVTFSPFQQEFLTLVCLRKESHTT
jgi:hypothetical protein